MNCFFCKKDAAREIEKDCGVVAGMVGGHALCETCSIELADVIFHAADGKFSRKTICKKLDKIMFGEEAQQ